MAADYIFINDNVHKGLEVHKVCLAVVDTPQFQRLRFIKQCGICNFVYPSAVHTRFEHSLGVSFKAKQMLDELRKIVEKDDIPDDHKICVELAGLCHDLGHGPFSHLWETFIANLVKDQNGNLDEKIESFVHEEMSVLIFREIASTKNVQDVFSKYNLSENHIDFVCGLITGKQLDCNVGTKKPKPYLYEIINNKISKFDVDKIEYLQRDSLNFGMPSSIDELRILKNMTVEDSQIQFKQKVQDGIFQIFHLRADMTRICYQHHTCKKLEVMLLDALTNAEKSGFTIKNRDLNGKLKQVKMSECHKKENLNQFCQLEDSILNTLLYSYEPEFENAKNIIKRMLTRDLYAEILGKSFEVEKPENEANDGIDTLTPNPKMVKNVHRIGESLVEELNKEFKNYKFHYSVVKINLGFDSGESAIDKVLFDCGSPNDYKLINFYKKDTKFLYEKLLLFCDISKNEVDYANKIEYIKEKAAELAQK